MLLTLSCERGSIISLGNTMERKVVYFYFKQYTKLFHSILWIYNCPQAGLESVRVFVDNNAAQRYVRQSTDVVPP